MPDSVVDTTEEAPVTTAESTVPETTPATPAPTDAPETTEAPTSTAESAPETTEAPPETTAELTIEEQINRDLALGEEALATVDADPGSQEARQELNRFFEGETLEAILTQSDKLAENGWIGTPNPDIPTRSELASNVEFTNAEQSRAIAAICRIDAVIVFDPEENIVINPDITRYVFNVEFRLDNGSWRRVRNLEDISTTPGATHCDV